MSNAMKWILRALLLLTAVVSLSVATTASLRAQTGPGSGHCAVCSYDFTDLENVIPSCSGGHEIGFAGCVVSGNYCTQFGECSGDSELQVFDISLFGELIVNAGLRPENSIVIPTKIRFANRYLAKVSARGTVPCAMAAAFASNAKDLTAPARRAALAFEL